MKQSQPSKLTGKTVRRLGALLPLLALASLPTIKSNAGSASFDLNTDPTTDPNGKVKFTGAAAWNQTGGVNNSGFIKLTDATGQTAGVLFPDFDKGLIVASFTFECQLKVGDWYGNPPADGFSVNYARTGDPVIGLIDGGTDPGRGGSTGWAGSFDNGGTETDLPEEGVQTGIGIGFDTWGTGNAPVGGSNGPNDVRGISVRVDGHQLTQIAMPSVVFADGEAHDFVHDATTLVTGPFSCGPDPANPNQGDPDCNGGSPPSTGTKLNWVPLKVTVGQDGTVNIYWKGVQIVTNLATTYFPSAGRIVFGASTGGAEEYVGIDDINITTVPSDKFLIGSVTPSPTGWSLAVGDSGQSVFDPKTGIVSLKYNGKDVVPTSTSKDTNGNSSIVYLDAANPIAAGSTNTVIMTAKDTNGTTETKTNVFVGIAYVNIDAATAAAGVDKTKPGFNIRIRQTDIEDADGNAHATDINSGVSVAQAERILQGDFGPNTADLSLYSGPGGTFNEKNVINYNAASGNIGDFIDDGSIANGGTAPDFPGLPGTAVRESGNDDVAAEIITYIEFPKTGAYQLGVNSDDGFRLTEAANPREVLNSTIVSQFDNGRGAADTTAWVYVGTAGVYPFRLLWFQGGGGANLEFWAINTDGVKALINDSTTAGALKAYSANGGAEPAAVTYTDPVRGSGRAIPAEQPITVQITDGATAVSNIKLNVNGADVTPTITKSGSLSTVVYSPSPFLPSNASGVPLKVSFTDGSKSYSGSTTFSTTAGTVIPASMALKASDVDTTKSGFNITTHQVAIVNNGGGHNGPGNSTEIGEQLVRGLLGWPNTADLSTFTGPGGSFVETKFINYNGPATTATGTASTAQGTFPDDGTAGGTAPDMPGIPGNPALNENGADDYGLEIRTVLDLQPGIYDMGVNSDDGFRLIVGGGQDAWTFPVVLGEFNGGRGSDNWGYTRFSFQVTKAGLYPFRMVFEEGGGGNNVEWFQVQKQWYPDQVNKVLINGTGGIKAYQWPSTSTASPTYVKSFSPGRSSNDSAASVGRAGQDATVSAVLVDGSTPVDKATVALKVNGSAVTPTITQAAGQTTVTYKPTSGFAMGSTNTVDLSFTDRTVSWTFIVGLPTTPTFWIEADDFNYGGGQTKPEASVMPYAGGAYVGLGATAGTDYDGPNDSDNPYYRYPNTLKVPVSDAADFDRGGGEVTVDYRLGWMGGHHWFNYTRTFPAGKYNVYIGLSSGSAGDRIYGNLEDVTGGASTVLGVFEGKMVTTGGGTWGNNNLLPLKDTATTNTVVSVDLSGTKTLRYNDGSGDYDFLLFAPVGGTVGPTQPLFGPVKIAGGNVTISWTGTGALNSSTDLKTFTPVPGNPPSPYTVPTSAAPHIFYRIQQ